MSGLSLFARGTGRTRDELIGRIFTGDITFDRRVVASIARWGPGLVF